MREKKCELCGKLFILTYNYLYKLRDKNQKNLYYCSYTCWKKAGGDGGIKNIHGIDKKC